MGEHPVRDDIDLMSGHWYAGQPYEQWAWMREHAPVYWDAKNEVWGITRYHDVLAIEKDAPAFNSHRSPRPHGQPLPMMISMDDPAHTRRRKLVNKGFTPRRVREHEQTIRQICTSIIDNVAPKGECDFVWDIAAPLPLLLIADMLGFPPESYQDLLEWSDDLIRGTTVNNPAAAAKAMYAGIAFREFMLGVIADRRTAFVVVSTLESAPVREAEFFVDALSQKKLHLGALVLNKVLPAYLCSDEATAVARRLCADPGPVAAALPKSVGDPDAVARVLGELGESFLNFQVVAKRESEQRAELGVKPDVVVAVPYLDRDVYDLAGLVEVGETIWA